MAVADETAGPEVNAGEGGRVLRLSGDWTLTHADAMERLVGGTPAGAGPTALDLGDLGRLDTVGALLIDRLRSRVGGDAAELREARDEQQKLLDAVARGDAGAPPDAPRRRGAGAVDLLADVGRAVSQAGSDFIYWLDILGAIVAACGRVLLRPARFRITSFTHHLELVGLRAVGIIGLISFLVGAIVAQQSIFQLQKFGATIFVADLIGILTLRELGVLLTAIMIAGRSGSAFTAEIGSMKMREEIDALSVMGLDPIEVLILPRLLALIVALTLLAFLAELASIAGGTMVGWLYGGISPEAFLARMKAALTMSSFAVGLIKAPFMGLIIGLIASIEGLKVEGSAESLGLRTTSSVVKAIFMVIVLDGIFAMMFAALGI